MTRLRTPWNSAPPPVPSSGQPLRAEHLVGIREPLDDFLRIQFGADLADCRSIIRQSLSGLVDHEAMPPSWLLPHQHQAYQKLRGMMDVFGGAILADAPGLGKTWVACAVARLYRKAVVTAPASILPQWHTVVRRLRVPIVTISHESMSQGNDPPPADLFVIDEAHRVRNPATIRYDRLARAVGSARILAVTATPIVNHVRDLIAVLQLFMPDHGLRWLGVPSLAAVSSTPDARVASAVRHVVVHRSWQAVQASHRPVRPDPVDEPVVQPPPIAEEALATVVNAVDKLAFVGVGSDRGVQVLLRRHIYRQLASSSAAALDTLTRHYRYTERARAAALRGETLSRQAARSIIAPAVDGQLDLLDGLAIHRDNTDLAEFDTQLAQLETTIQTLRAHASPSPKLQALERLLAERCDARTIVFTTSIRTATAIATGLDWRRVATATGHGARIASGRVNLQTALDLFAPHARGARTPHARDVITTLVATDMVSEGLNLQDADGIVHYDIPWTPVRLQQRLGRIARLGSRHQHARTWWFAPEPSLDRRIGLSNRIARKASTTRTTLGTHTSHVGDGDVAGHSDVMDRLAATSSLTVDVPVSAVVQAGPQAAIALEWSIGPHRVPEVVVWSEGNWVETPADQAVILGFLLGAEPAAATEMKTIQRAVHSLVRERLKLSRSWPDDAATRRARKQTLILARSAARNRNVKALHALNGVLARLGTGLNVGGHRTLNDVLGKMDVSGLDAWCRKWAERKTSSVSVRLLGCIVGAIS